MAIEIDPSGSTYMTVRLSGKLTAEDYEQLVPAVEKVIKERGTLRMLIEMRDFHGWDLAATWEDTKFGLRHYHDIDRLAMVGEKVWQRGMAVFCKPFTRAAIKYFDVSEIDEARSWVEAD